MSFLKSFWLGLLIANNVLNRSKMFHLRSTLKKGVHERQQKTSKFPYVFHFANFPLFPCLFFSNFPVLFQFPMYFFHVFPIFLPHIFDNDSTSWFEGVCLETAVILAPGAMTGEVGAAVADTVSSGSSASSGSEFREGADDCENTIYWAIVSGKCPWKSMVNHGYL